MTYTETLAIQPTRKIGWTEFADFSSEGLNMLFTLGMTLIVYQNCFF